MASDSYFYFQQKQTDLENQNIPSNELVMQMIEYARELEIIV